MTKFILVLVTMNQFGHSIYHTSESFHERSACEVRRGQVSMRPNISKAMCIEADPTYYEPPVRHVKLPERK